MTDQERRIQELETELKMKEHQIADNQQTIRELQQNNLKLYKEQSIKTINGRDIDLDAMSKEELEMYAQRQLVNLTSDFVKEVNDGDCMLMDIQLATRIKNYACHWVNTHRNDKTIEYNEGVIECFTDGYIAGMYRLMDFRREVKEWLEFAERRSANMTTSQ